MSVSKEDKIDLNDINQRFLNYVSKVRQLKNEEDISIINQSINMLEEELKILKSSYESQISQLKTTLDIIVTQKLDLEKELLSRKNTEIHLNDRLTVESSKNSKLLHELSCLRSDISGGEQEIISLNLMIKQLRLERSDAEGNGEKLMRNLQESNNKILRNEEKIRDYENQISCMKQKIEFQDHFFSEKFEEMKSRQEEYLEKMVSMDYKIEEAKQRESQWPEILEKIQQTTAEEFKAFKVETEEFFNERISYLQHQLESEISENNQLKQTNELNNDKLLSLRKKEAELNTTIECLQRRVEITEKALADDKHESERVIQSLQNKIKQLQHHITMEIDQAKNGKSSHNVSIRGEIEFIKRLLTEEEKRLDIKSDHHYNNSDEKENTINKFPNDKIEEKHLLNNFQADVMDSQKNILNDYVDDVSEEDVEDQNNNRYINNISTEENIKFESDSLKAKSNENNEYYSIDQNNSYMDQNEENRVFDNSENIDNNQFWTEANNGFSVKSQMSVGPISHLEKPVGPVRPVSSTPLPHSDRPPRPFSANLRGSRTKSCISHQESMNKDCQSRNSNNHVDSGLGQSPDYFDSLFKKDDQDRKEDQNTIKSKDTNETSLTPLKVLEINKDGKYLKIWNSSDKYDTEIGGYIIKQNRFGHPVSVFRFPDRVKFPANSTITIWSGSNDPLLHQPPTDFFSSQPLVWGSNPEYTTILCNSFGQALSWTSAVHRINPDPYRAKTAPIISKDRKRENSQKLPELIPNNLTNNEPIYLIKNNTDNLTQPIHHPFTSTTKSAIHPCMEGYRGKTNGNDNSSFNRQTRQQNDNIPDPMIAQPYAGTNAQRMLGSAKIMHFYPPTIQSSHSLNNRMPEVIFRSYAEPPNAFQKPQSRFITGLDQVQSMHNNLYQTRMYKTETNPSAN